MPVAQEIKVIQYTQDICHFNFKMKISSSNLTKTSKSKGY